jgi:hypothetical protein
MVPVSAGALILPGVTGGGFADNIVRQADGAGIGAAGRATTIDEIYETLASTETGAKLLPRATRYGRPETGFNEALGVGNWGEYLKGPNKIGLNPVYRTLPPEFGAAALAHELVHRQRRLIKTTIGEEILAHRIEGRVWGELQERALSKIGSELTVSQQAVLRSHNQILRLTTSQDAGALLRHLGSIPNYARLPIIGTNFLHPKNNREINWIKKWGR